MNEWNTDSQKWEEKEEKEEEKKILPREIKKILFEGLILDGEND